MTLYGKKALILGTGDIGRNIANRLKAFGVSTAGIHRQKSSDGDTVCVSASDTDSSPIRSREIPPGQYDQSRSDYLDDYLPVMPDLVHSLACSAHAGLPLGFIESCASCAYEAGSPLSWNVGQAAIWCEAQDLIERAAGGRHWGRRRYPGCVRDGAAAGGLLPCGIWRT